MYLQYKKYAGNHPVYVIDKNTYGKYISIPDYMLKKVEAVPVNNLRRDSLQTAMNRAECAEMFESIVQPDTVLHKLSWRESYSKTTQKGDKSIYICFWKKF